MKRVITALVFLLIITVSSCLWVRAATGHFQPLQRLVAEARESYTAGNTDEALNKTIQLAKEYEERTRYFDLFISHQVLLETEKCVESLPLILQYGDEKDFVNEAKRCELLLQRLWEQEIPRFDTVF